ncbi:unnamed protein product [Didymodactylos carnosus]|uniref:Uncharacterized protein n=1 Tax=Didymodactylos carnosus TaxID=1234261 RepID=A0A814JVQ5_9BILA|nr:unnamed protein product [Didymodactylos carnosus]CAF1042678.1 unnamed protein product [Didymodactylos carnosus]CAF3744786.1 unnamed protein product [Didymodactylos carnosus]CAF3812826.1 unnamed protein product [Didymodactylos carnosus]
MSGETAQLLQKTIYGDISDPVVPTPYIKVSDEKFELFADWQLITETTNPATALAVLLSLYNIFEIKFTKNNCASHLLYGIIFQDGNELGKSLRTVLSSWDYIFENRTQGPQMQKRNDIHDVYTQATQSSKSPDNRMNNYSFSSERTTTSSRQLFSPTIERRQKQIQRIVQEVKNDINRELHDLSSDSSEKSEAATSTETIQDLSSSITTNNESTLLEDIISFDPVLTTNNEENEDSAYRHVSYEWGCRYFHIRSHSTTCRGMFRIS